MFYLSEFIGTMILILLGNGVVYNIIGKKTNASGKDYINIAIGWGLAVLIAVIASLAMGGVAHLNPAVSIAFMIEGSISAVDGIIFILLQIVGAMVGQMLLNLIYIHEVKAMKEKCLGAHSTSTPYEKATKAPFLNEIVGTAVLLVVIVFMGRVTADFTKFLGPVLVALTVTGIGIALGGVTGWAINPARDLGPRIVFALTAMVLKFEGDRKKMPRWDYAWIPVAAPAISGLIIGAFGLIK